MKTTEMIRNFIVSELATGRGGRTIENDDLLIENGIIDSFGIMSLLGFIEETFRIRIEGDELMPENFASISTISALVGRKGGQAEG